MGDPSTPREALSLLGEVYRERGTGVLSVGTGAHDPRAAIRDGDVVGLCPPPGAGPAAADPFPGPDDSAERKLEQVLVEVGLRRPRRSPPAKGPSVGELRQGLVSGLADGDARARFDETDDLPRDALPLSAGTEPLILEAVRRMTDVEAIQRLLGDLDQPLSATPAAPDQRTLTLTEGALLSRVDGVVTARQVLESAPLEADDAQRGLVGLLLTGRVMYQPATVPPVAASEAPLPPAENSDGGDPREPRAEAPPPEPTPEAGAAATPERAPEPPPASAGPIGTEALAEKQAILELFQALPLLSHFEILGLEPGCTDTEARRAYVARVKRYHPDAQRDPALGDLHDVLEAIFIRVSEAWEVLGSEKKRTAYESRLRGDAARRDKGEKSSPADAGDDARDEGDETLLEAERLLGEARFWDAIQILESAVPRLQPQSRRHRGELLLARAYARNPKWVRRAEKALQSIVGEDPANAEAYYQLGLLYKTGGLSARARAMFRKAVELRPGYREATAHIVSSTPSPAPPRGLLRRLFGG